MYAIGGNESAAEVAGINVAASKIRIYMLAGLLYGLTGFLVCAKSGGCSVNTGMGWELEAIAGCTIGGVSVNGGVGKITGILIGVLVFEVLKIVLQFLGVESSYTYVAQGLVIIIAVIAIVAVVYLKMRDTPKEKPEMTFEQLEEERKAKMAAKSEKKTQKTESPSTERKRYTGKKKE